jgi:fucose 4-O-acetylase-like acetyltransferase
MVSRESFLLETFTPSYDLMETDVSVVWIDCARCNCRVFAHRRVLAQLQSSFVFLPFFVIGYDYGATIRSHLLSGWGRRTAAILSAALLVWIGYGGLNISSGWLLGSMTYAELGHHEWYAGIFRLGVYLLEIASGALFLAWVPFLTSRLTDLGRRTLYVFLLHGFLVRLAIWSGVYSYMGSSAYIPVILLIAVLFAVTLALPVVRHAFKPLIEPDISRFSFNRHEVFKRSA